MKKTLVIGASENPQRYSYKAMVSLTRYYYEVLAWGLRPGEVNSVKIETDLSVFTEKDDIHTVTLYMNPKNQESYWDEILKLKPKRVIFNPGTENPDIYPILSQLGIQYQEACTLVLLATNQY